MVIVRDRNQPNPNDPSGNNVDNNNDLDITTDMDGETQKGRIQARLEYLSPDPETVFGNPNSFQSRALEWLLDDVLYSSLLQQLLDAADNDDSGNNFSDTDDETAREIWNRFETRYALAIFYYATQGEEDWKNRYDFVSSTLHECNWTSRHGDSEKNVLDTATFGGGGQGITCNDQWQVTDLSLGTCCSDVFVVVR
jgi:hypothetical protein